MKTYDVAALGELLIDFTQNGISEQGNSLFEANPGGAPCNVLAMLSKLGHKTAFIGKVGNDIFGHRLKKVLEELSGVESAEVSHEAGTAIVTLSSDVSDDILKKTVEDQGYKVTE